MDRRLWPPLSEIPEFSKEVEIRTFESGERRVSKDPPPAIVRRAFDELGTNVAVAAAFGVTRHVVERWISSYGMTVVSKPEIRHANFVRRCLEREGDRLRVAQWVMDEGSVGVTYQKFNDSTVLLVCGSMNDSAALDVISSILKTPTNCAKSARSTTLPLLGVRMISSKAYALLNVLLPDLRGLKAMEAHAALSFFTPSGYVSGRHTTDEFLAPVWREFALDSVKCWSARRQKQLTEEEITGAAEAWTLGRIRRARRFLVSAGVGLN